MSTPDTVPIPKAPSRAQIIDIIKRYLKVGAAATVPPDWQKEIPVFYQLWRQYPSLPFWTHHELGFPLNSMCFFKTDVGVAALESAWVVFHYQGAPEPSAAPVEVDSTPESTYHESTYTPVIPPRPQTTAGFLGRR